MSTETQGPPPADGLAHVAFPDARAPCAGRRCGCVDAPGERGGSLLPPCFSPAHHCGCESAPGGRELTEEVSGRSFRPRRYDRVLGTRTLAPPAGVVARASDVDSPTTKLREPCGSARDPPSPAFSITSLLGLRCLRFRRFGRWLRPRPCDQFGHRRGSLARPGRTRRPLVDPWQARTLERDACMVGYLLAHHLGPTLARLAALPLLARRITTFPPGRSCVTTARPPQTRT